jgi:hypothetical protein
MATLAMKEAPTTKYESRMKALNVDIQPPSQAKQQGGETAIRYATLLAYPT